MKILFQFIFVIAVFGNTAWGQKGIGVSYGLHAFPLQKKSYRFDESSGPESVWTISKAPEHAVKLFFEMPTRSEKTRFHFGISTYSTSLDFKSERQYSTGSGDVNGSYGESTFYTKTGTYQYHFIGLEAGNTRSYRLSERFSYFNGFSGGANMLVFEKTFNKVFTTKYSSSTTTYSGPNAGTTTQSSVTQTSQVEDIHNVRFNVKFELSFGFSYQVKSNVFSLSALAGFRTSSRVVIDSGFNAYLSPQFSYTWILH